MAEFVIKLADERGRVQEQIQSAATAEELRARFSHAGYHVFSVRARSMVGLSRRKVKLEPFLIFNSQFLTLIRCSGHSGGHGASTFQDRYCKIAWPALQARGQECPRHTDD